MSTKSTKNAKDVKSFEEFHEENSQVLPDIKRKFGSNFKLKTKLKSIGKKERSVSVNQRKP